MAGGLWPSSFMATLRATPARSIRQRGDMRIEALRGVT